MKIGWIGPVSSKNLSGGIVYGEGVIDALSKDFELDFINIEGKHFKNRYLKGVESLFNLLKLNGKRDLWFRDFFSTVTWPLDKTEGKNLVIVHHMGFYTFPLWLAPACFLLEKIFYHNLKKADAIVTVCKYWQNYFLELGYKKVFIIYNGFNINDFNISQSDVLDFKKKYNLLDKPIIYLGNCQKAKGVVEAYDALKDIDASLVTSGKPHAKIPAINLNLSYKDYLCLLRASSVVLTMSKFREGWCRTAHEAMLCKTPVIGSGLGGMQELLEGGKQIICRDFSSLRKEVESLLNDPEKASLMGVAGHNFAKEFTIEKFKNNWLDLVKKII